jgi:hypothetical protein
MQRIGKAAPVPNIAFSLSAAAASLLPVRTMSLLLGSGWERLSLYLQRVAVDRDRLSKRLARRDGD